MNPWAPAHRQPPSLSDDIYDPDDVVPKNSPLFKAVKPVALRPSPSTSPESETNDSPPGNRSRGNGKGHRHSTNKANPGDAVLVSFLGGTDGRNQEIANIAGIQALPSDCSEDQDPSALDDSASELSLNDSKDDRGLGRRPSAAQARGGEVSMSIGGLPSDEAAPAPPLHELQSLAAGALGALASGGHREETSEGSSRTHMALDTSALDRGKLIVAERGIRRDGPEPLKDLDRDRPREDRERDDRNSVLSATSPYSPRSGSAYSHSPLQPPSLSPRHHQVGIRSPRNPELPPIQDIMSPRSDANGGHIPLPSIRDAFSDLGLGETQDRRQSASYTPHSPPGSFPRLGSLAAGSVGSPPVSPNDFRRDLPSPAPHMSAATSPFYPHHPGHNGFPRHSTDYSSSSATETPGSTGDYAHTPAGTGPDGRMIVDGLQTSVGTFVCKFPGCVSMPFHTQYLLNSHMNVHSSVRPHYCPVKGCPRSEGGKGFKRKNEMIRHGLVHDSPGYICPFCPDREHKYPRPDNLQRHVRVHHVDKDKDDPMLRDVLAQRPDGPNRGRRRRHGPG